MKTFLKSVALIFCLACSGLALARQNPAVQPAFFLLLQSEMPRSAPAPVSTNGDVTEVTLKGLAWAVDNMKNDPTPLVVELYSSDLSDCAVAPQTGDNECTLQETATPAAAAHYVGRVKFLRVNVTNFPVLLAGPDVRVRPSHMVIAQYTDGNNYTAMKVGGYLSNPQLESLVKEILGLDP